MNDCVARCHIALKYRASKVIDCEGELIMTQCSKYYPMCDIKKYSKTHVLNRLALLLSKMEDLVDAY